MGPAAPRAYLLWGIEWRCPALTAGQPGVTLPCRQDSDAEMHCPTAACATAAGPPCQMPMLISPVHQSPRMLPEYAPPQPNLPKRLAACVPGFLPAHAPACLPGRRLQLLSLAAQPGSGALGCLLPCIDSHFHCLSRLLPLQLHATTQPALSLTRFPAAGPAGLPVRPEAAPAAARAAAPSCISPRIPALRPFPQPLLLSLPSCPGLSLWHFVLL